MNSELGSKKWLFRALAFQFGVGYTLAMLVTQVGSLLVYGKPAVGFIPAIIVAALIVAFLVITIRKSDSKRVELGVDA